MKELIKGKWYTTNDPNDPDKIALKFSHLSGNSLEYVYFTAYIRKREKVVKDFSGNWFNINLKLVNVLDLKQYFPKDHPDIKQFYSIY